MGQWGICPAEKDIDLILSAVIGILLLIVVFFRLLFDKRDLAEVGKEL